MKCIENRYTLILLCKKTLFPLLSNFRVVCAIMIFVLQLLPMSRGETKPGSLLTHIHISKPALAVFTLELHVRSLVPVPALTIQNNYPWEGKRVLG